MSSRGHGPVCPGTELRHTNGDDKHARYGPLGDGEAGVQVTGEWAPIVWGRLMDR